MITVNLPWVESPFFSEILAEKQLDEAQLKYVRDYHENGFVVLPGMIPEQLIDRVKYDADQKGFNREFPYKGQRDERRVQDLWQVSEASSELACYPQLLSVLELLYGREVIPFQTLNFKYGSQQRAHSDTIHFSSLPARFMCGVWVALEDITEENGPVFYFSGSHRLPEYDFSSIRTDAGTTSYGDYVPYEDFIEKIVAAHGFEKKKFLAKKGDLLIWSSNIIHGGSMVTKEGATRWSQVTHYFFKDCYYYTPMLSNMVTRELFLRNNLINIRTGERVEQSYNGEKLFQFGTNKKRYNLLSRKPGIWEAISAVRKGRL